MFCHLSNILNIIEERELEYNLIAYHNIWYHYNAVFLNGGTIYWHLGQKNNSLSEILLSIALAYHPWSQNTECLWGPRVMMISKKPTHIYKYSEWGEGDGIVPNWVRFIGIWKFEKSKTLFFPSKFLPTNYGISRRNVTCTHEIVLSTPTWQQLIFYFLLQLSARISTLLYS